VVKIEVAGDAKSSTEFPTSDKGILFYFNFPSSWSRYQTSFFLIKIINVKKKMVLNGNQEEMEI